MLGLALLGDEGEEPLLGLVVRAVRDLVERVLVHRHLRLGVLDRHPGDGDVQLGLGRLPGLLLAELGLLHLLLELELLDALLHHLDALGLVHLGAAEELENGDGSVSRFGKRGFFFLGEEGRNYSFFKSEI